MSENNTNKTKTLPPHFKAILLLTIIGILCLLSILFILYSKTQTDVGYTAYIYQDGKLCLAIDLSEIKESKTLSFETGDGGYNTVLVTPGEIAVTDANCPDKVCVHMGAIRTKSIPIVCLPHKLVIELKENTKNKPDAISY